MSSAITYKDILGAVAKDEEGSRYKNFVENLGVLVNKTYNEAGDGTAAHIAARYGNLGIVKFATEKDPTILGYTDVGDNTIYLTAIQNGQIDIVKYLVERHGFDGVERVKRRNGNTGIHHACEHSQLAILKYFLEEKNCDVDVTNNLGQPPIFLAVRKKLYPIIMYLTEERNANLNLLDHNGNNVLYMAVDSDDVGILKYLFKKMNFAANIEYKNIFGDTLLSRAATSGSYAVLKYLTVKEHADVNARDISNKTALHGAARKNNHYMCKFLIKHGADLHAKGDDGKLPWNEASKPLLTEFLEKQTKLRELRERRSVHDFPQFSSSQTVSIPHLRARVISGVPNPTNRLDGGPPAPPDNGGMFQFASFLTMGNMITYRTSEHRLHAKIPSPPELLLGRMEPIAVEASSELFVD